MNWIEVLVEGASDTPTIKEVLERRFNLVEGQHFRIHPHRGKGTLPQNPLSKPQLKHQGLLDQLPAKLRGFGKSLPADAMVLVVVDADNQPVKSLLADLNKMLVSLPVKPNVLLRLAVEETESWFIADIDALQKAYPGQVRKSVLRNIKPDSIVGASEKLAEALGIGQRSVAGPTKFQWAQRIAPHLNLENPSSPSFKKLIEGIADVLKGKLA